MRKPILWACGALIALALCALVTTALLNILLDPFLAIVNIPVLTERLGGLSFGRIFILVCTLRLLASAVLPIHFDTEDR
jgi:hypothetical protein